MRRGVTRHDLETVGAALRRLGLDNLSLRYIDEMSGGELQKVAIARALVQEPGLMLLDEPTASLDLKNQVEILTIIRRMVTEHDVAAVMTMHDLNTALRYADKCIFHKNGKIFYAGPPQSVDTGIIEAVQGKILDELNTNLKEVIEMLLEDGVLKLEGEFVGTQTVTVA